MSPLVVWHQIQCSLAMQCSESCSVCTMRTPRHGRIYTMKVDIADGFYRVGLAPEDVPSPGVCLPPGRDGKTLVAFP